MPSSKASAAGFATDVERNIVQVTNRCLQGVGRMARCLQ